ncbi:sulfotransferase family 2 domain-containing protein [Oceaniglobus trochenteri]|uniref:sulfotransferase family 2 domain-containing protein n=1 Tax=Oceaniglobus trochenteri TaxID=2763260 RepID=UPI001D001295|nr:sulfotransferase family 2 domain-containing protein [Oceaniglobus trochenteri]
MPYVIPDRKIAVFFSPKGAGTTIRAAMFRAENGFPFRPYRVEGREMDENSICRNTKFSNVDHGALEGFERIAILRDPVRRFLSAYSNRVLHYRELSEKAVGRKLRQHGLAPDPDIDTFVDHIDEYRRVSRWIAHHTARQNRHLGNDPDHFHHVFRTEDLSAFTRHLSHRFAPQPAPPRLQTGGPKFRPEDLSPETLRRIEAFVVEDIAYEMHPDYARTLELARAA